MFNVRFYYDARLYNDLFGRYAIDVYVSVGNSFKREITFCDDNYKESIILSKNYIERMNKKINSSFIEKVKFIYKFYTK